MKVKESLNVTFDETPPPSKTSPLEDDDLVEEKAIEDSLIVKPNHVYRLKKALYGLKQAPKAWPDIMFSVCLCARFQEDPKISDLDVVKPIFRYVKGTMHLGLWYPKGSDVETIVYTDSDHAENYVDRKSTGGICTFMGCCLTSWFSKKQTALAISTTKANYELVDVVKKTLEFGAQGVEYGKEDAELDMAKSYNYITNEMLGKLLFVRLDYGKYGEPFILFGRDFLVTTKCKVDFGLGETLIDLTMLKEERDIDALLVSLVEDIDEEKLIENDLPKKMCDPRNFVLPVRVNGTTQISALADTGASASVLPYTLYKNLSLGDPSSYYSNLTMADNKQAKAIDEDGNPKYGPVAPSFLEIEDDMERALAMEAYFNPFKNIIVSKKLIDFLRSLSVQLKHTNLGSKGHGVYRKIEGDGLWHTKFEVITPSGHMFTTGFKTKETKRKPSRKFIS
nr:copia protein [Tanacetum cinerariifolium]